MRFGKNLQHLRQRSGNMTQENLAHKLGVSRQTVSKWESGESTPELGKLIELCDIFSCTMDTLLREDLPLRSSLSLPVRMTQVQGFRYAACTIISRHPEEDSRLCLTHWVELCGLNLHRAVQIGWGFPYLTQEQRQRFGLRGYVCAMVLPEGFETEVPGAEIAAQETASYAVTTVPIHFPVSSDKIAGAIELIFEYMNANNIQKQYKPGIIPCFHHIYSRDSETYMDVYIHCQHPSKEQTVTELKLY